MYLKTIDVQGFKSFANKLTFEFHNGITGIVGPNGSGKSNVADAVRWVLGEQSARQLRGGNMQDVIFSGTEARKPLSSAYVAITLDNSDRKLDIDYNEITVARRIYRSGESEYLINGSSCRLKDVHELFYDTGIGKEGYSIIGQGQIEKILSGKPEERRELFDEAAGIVKFKRRKAVALKKLEDEKQSLVRISDILSELTTQLAPLEKQAEKAKIYLQKKEELKKREIELFLFMSDNTEKKLSDILSKYNIADAEYTNAQKNFEDTKTEYDLLEGRMAKLDSTIQSLKDLQNSRAVSLQELEGRISLLDEQISFANQKFEDGKNLVKTYSQELAEKKELKAKYNTDFSEITKKLEGYKVSEKRYSGNISEIEKEIESLEREIESGKNEIIDLLNTRSSIKGNIQRYDAMLEQIDIRKAQLNQQILSMKTDEEFLNSQYGQSLNSCGEVDARIDLLTSKNSSLESQVDDIRQQLIQKKKYFDDLQTDYHRASSRLESLKNIAERYDGYGNSIKKIMEKRSLYPGINGVVANLIHSDKKYELAVETALGGTIQNIVTDNEQTARDLIAFLKKNRFGRATFLPLTAIKDRQSHINAAVKSEEGVIGIAADLVHTEAKYKSLCGYLLGRILVVDNIDNAIAISKKYHNSVRMVTLEGDMLNIGGSMSGGAYRHSENLLGRKREIEELKIKVDEISQNISDTKDEISKIREIRNDLRDKMAVVEEELGRLRIKKNTATINMNSAKEKLEHIRDDYGARYKERSKLDNQIVEIKESKLKTDTEISELDKKQLELESDTDRAQAKLLALRGKKDTLTTELEKIRIEISGSSQSETFLRENIKRTDAEIEDIYAKIDLAKSTSFDASSDIETKTSELKSIKSKIKREQEESVDTEKTIDEHLKKKEKMSIEHKSFFEKRDRISLDMARLDKERFRLNSQIEKLNEEQEQRISYLWSEYELTPSQAREVGTNASPKNTIRDVNALKSEIHLLGNVNVNAIEDYKNVSQRHDFLSGQYNDLVESKEALMKIVEDLDTGMRKQFAEKFDEIKKEFDRVFRQLFGGGKGSLELISEDDILESGIRIIAQPPGKKLQNMMQLSGGEKSLTAISLLFAIQNLKPSPFCLLDEIEAALDDSNVGRFADYLHKLTENTQFIVITHRRGTMNAADRLYGITMQEKGVSTLVSVDLIEKEL